MGWILKTSRTSKIHVFSFRRSEPAADIQPASDPIESGPKIADQSRHHSFEFVESWPGSRRSGSGLHRRPRPRHILLSRSNSDDFVSTETTTTVSIRRKAQTEFGFKVDEAVQRLQKISFNNNVDVKFIVERRKENVKGHERNLGKEVVVVAAAKRRRDAFETVGRRWRRRRWGCRRREFSSDRCRKSSKRNVGTTNWRQAKCPTKQAHHRRNVCSSSKSGKGNDSRYFLLSS